MKVLVIHGPNLNLLGTREPDVYGTMTLQQINEKILSRAKGKDVQVECVQFDSEGDIVKAIGEASSKGAKWLIINPAAYTHTSVAIRDAISAAGIKAIEVHLSNIYAREEFRHHSMIAPIAMGQISGFGAAGYILALDAIVMKSV
ncbi:MAG: type II 3-dehydroquinate dehydratase [Candidatus Theseobacter exili]|nr:type II 3-dehydroquinate dehydratase [Candidatus Theseobacter exili]